MYYDDPCWDDPYFSCHDDGDFPSYDDWSDDPGDAQYWDAESCPAGCTTYALGAATRGAIVNELGNILDTSDCQAVKGFLVSKMNGGHIRFYANADGDWGDYHPDSGDIHLYTTNFLPGEEHELGMTLMHEGYHGYFGDSNDNAAENFAYECVEP